MKERRIIILMIAVMLTVWSCVEAGDWSLTRPGGVGFVLVGTRQDASQMQGSGLGLGAEVFLRYPLSSRLALSGGTGLYTATDDIFKMENQKSVFLPTLELRAEWTLSRGEWFKPFVYSGIQFFGATSHVRGIEGAQYSEHSYQGCILAGLGADIYLGSSSWSLYLSSDYRYAVFSTITPHPQYWIGKAGLCFKLGNPKWLSQRRVESEFPPEIMKLMSTTDADESMESSHYEAGNRWETGLLNERVSQMERCILQNANSIQEMAAHIQAYVQAVASVTNAGLFHSQRENEASRVVDEISYKNVYQKSIQKFKLGEYDGAIQILEDLRTRFPNHALASNCSYWIGECYHARGQYQEAIIEFENVFKYAASYKYDDALLMKGKCYTRLGNRNQANINFKNLIDQYPDSEYVSTARNLLKNL
jgi:tol-pal system protein YbgF